MWKPLHSIRATLALLVLSGAALAVEPPRTTITLKELDCESCAKRLAGKLKQVPGVAEVKTDLPAKMAVVTPQLNKQPSPRVLWETAEDAGFEPVKLEGPTGTFKGRPKS